MKVRCLSNKSNHFKIHENVNNNFYGKDKAFKVSVDQIYAVYGLAVHGGYLHYCLCTGSGFGCSPRYYPAPLFEVIDGRISRHLVFHYRRSESYLYSSFPIWAFPEWANGDDFYPGLVVGNEDELTIFNEYKSKMDLEFQDPNVIATATILDEAWLMCPDCIDGWEYESTLDALVACPYCRKK